MSHRQPPPQAVYCFLSFPYRSCLLLDYPRIRSRLFASSVPDRLILLRLRCRLLSFFPDSLGGLVLRHHELYFPLGYFSHTLPPMYIVQLNPMYIVLPTFTPQALRALRSNRIRARGI